MEKKEIYNMAKINLQDMGDLAILEKVFPFQKAKIDIIWDICMMMKVMLFSNWI